MELKGINLDFFGVKLDEMHPAKKNLVNFTIYKIVND